MVDFFQNVFVGFRLIDVLDIVIVAYLVYKILGFIQETRAQQLVRGLVVLGIVFFLSDFLKLYLLNWLLRNFVTMGLFALIVLFQPELRVICHLTEQPPEQECDIKKNPKLKNRIIPVNREDPV